MIWWEQALCRGVNPETFFPKQGASNVKARQYCGRCPVSTECLEEAMQRPEQYGIWGGLTPQQRSRKLDRPLSRTRG